MAQTMTQRHTAVTTTSGLDLIAGLWLIAAPFLLGYAGTAMTNDVIVGLAITVLAASRLIGRGYAHSWPSWLNAMLGVWLILAPFFLGYSNATVPFWNDVIVGAVVAVLATTSALSTPREHDQDRRV